MRLSLLEPQEQFRRTGLGEGGGLVIKTRAPAIKHRQGIRRNDFIVEQQTKLNG